MADTVTTLSLVTLAQQYRGDVVRQINRRTVLLRLLPIVRGEGKNVAFATEADGALAENYTDGADAANFGGDAQASATLSWSLYRSNFHVSQLALDSSSTSATPAGNRALWARQMVNGGAKLATTLNAALYNGAGTGTTMAGLDVAIGSTSNTYAGIDRSSNSYFRPIVVDPGSLTAPTFALIRDDMRQIYEACGENPDIAMCPPAVFNKIGSLFDSTRRQIDVVNTARGAIRLEFGFGALEVDGCVFIKDKDATANQIYYLNTNHVRLEYLPPSDQAAMAGQMMQVEPDDGFGVVPLGFRYDKLAKLGASERAQITATTQLVVDRPNSCGIRKNVAT